MRVLVGCEFSGTVRESFRKKGHDAWSCDLIPSEIEGQHIKGDVLEVLNDNWDLAIFHPPCTHLAISGARWFKEKKQEQEEALEFIRKLLEAPIGRIALENPISIISSKIRKPDQIIQPWMFGHPESKATCLWLKNLPPLHPTQIATAKRYKCKCGNIVKAGELCCGLNLKPIWDNQTPSGQNKLGPSPTRAMERSRTYQGIADAMADSWGIF